MRLPWVSRRYAELLEQLLEQTRHERDTQSERADRAVDNLWLAHGQGPVSSVVRREAQAEQEKVSEYLAGQNNEDPMTGMLSEDDLSLLTGDNENVMENLKVTK